MSTLKSTGGHERTDWRPNLAVGYTIMGSWFSIIKIIILVRRIICGIIITAGGVPGTDPIGFRYWRIPGPFRQENGNSGTQGSFLAVRPVLSGPPSWSLASPSSPARLRTPAATSPWPSALSSALTGDEFECWEAWCTSINKLTKNKDSSGPKSFWVELSREDQLEVKKELEAVSRAIEETPRDAQPELPTQRKVPLISAMIDTMQEGKTAYERQLQLIVAELGHARASATAWKEWLEEVNALLAPHWPYLPRRFRWSVVKELSGVVAEIRCVDRDGPYYREISPPSLNLFPALKTVENMKANERLKSLAHGRVRLSPRQQSNYDMRYAGNAGF
ncbi:hypothetical protein JCM1840_004999 [Sporobolomyces johnsonii]